MLAHRRLKLRLERRVEFSRIAPDPATFWVLLIRLMGGGRQVAIKRVAIDGG